MNSNFNPDQPLVFSREPETLENAIQIAFSTSYPMLPAVREQFIEPVLTTGRFTFFFRALMQPFASVGQIFSERIFKPSVASFSVTTAPQPDRIILRYSVDEGDGPSLRTVTYEVPGLSFNNTFQTFCLSVDVTNSTMVGSSVAAFSRLIVNGQEEDDIQFNLGVPNFTIGAVSS